MSSSRPRRPRMLYFGTAGILQVTGNARTVRIIPIHMRLFAFGGLYICLWFPLQLPGQTVRFETSVGNIDVELLPNNAPKTVANFLAYLHANAYANSFIHRSVPKFVFQGGGYQWSDTNGPVAISKNAPVVNEFKVSNTSGTL